MKKLLSMLLICVMVISMGCITTFAESDIPSDLPEGTVKIAEGIYMYTPAESDVMPLNSLDWVTIPTVPAYGTIVQPSSLSNIIVGTSDNYICIQSSASIRINLVRNNTSIFGTNIGNWPKIGGSTTTTYYIEADYYNINKGVAYQMQCTSANTAKSNVRVRYFTDPDKSDFLD